MLAYLDIPFPNWFISIRNSGSPNVKHLCDGKYKNNILASHRYRSLKVPADIPSLKYRAKSDKKNKENPNNNNDNN